MFHKDNPEYNRRQIGFYTLDELVPKDHFLRKVEETIDFSFIEIFLQIVLMKRAGGTERNFRSTGSIFIRI